MRIRRVFCAVIVLLLSAFCFVLPLLFPVATPAAPQPSPTVEPTPTATAAPQASEAFPYRAVWVSYLEWQAVDFSSPAAYRADLGDMLDNISALGATVVLAQVRPFGDALYPSRFYPFSQLCTGVQGQDPGFDPLGILIAAAHARHLQVEAWCNPYRLQVNGAPTLCAASPAQQHPEWVKTADGNLYLDPANAAVQQYIADAVDELCENYPLDGIHFDDYFYPTTAADFDAADYADYCAATLTPLPLADWRCGNVNALLRLCHAAAAKHGIRFGVAPQGDPAQALASQYSDAAAWLATPGCIDYLMPQLYWGQQYRKNGDTGHALQSLAEAWSALPRAQGTRLYFGLGAYRIGDGDGSDNGAAEWQSGHALADSAALLRRYGSGVGLYRYASLYQNAAWPALAAQECTALHNLWAANSA